VCLCRRLLVFPPTNEDDAVWTPEIGAALDAKLVNDIFDEYPPHILLLLRLPPTPLFISDLPLFISDVPLFISDVPLFISDVPLFISDLPLFISDLPLSGVFILGVFILGVFILGDP
jgi:hypothetical protein